MLDTFLFSALLCLPIDGRLLLSNAFNMYIIPSQIHSPASERRKKGAPPNKRTADAPSEAVSVARIVHMRTANSSKTLTCAHAENEKRYPVAAIPHTMLGAARASVPPTRILRPTTIAHCPRASACVAGGWLSCTSADNSVL